MAPLTEERARDEIGNALRAGFGEPWRLTWEKRHRIRIVDQDVATVRFLIERHPHHSGISGAAYAADVRVVINQVFELVRATRRLKLLSVEFVRLEVNWDTLIHHVIALPAITDLKAAAEDRFLTLHSEDLGMLHRCTLDAIKNSRLLNSHDEIVPPDIRDDFNETFCLRLAEFVYPDLEKEFIAAGWCMAIVRSCDPELAAAKARLLHQIFILGNRNGEGALELVEDEVCTGDLGKSLCHRYSNASATDTWQRTIDALIRHLADKVVYSLRTMSFTPWINQIAKDAFGELEVEVIASSVTEHVRRKKCSTSLEARRHARDIFTLHVTGLTFSSSGLHADRLAQLEPQISEEMFNMLWDRIRSRCLEA